MFIRNVGGLLDVNYILNRNFVRNCEGTKSVYTFPVQINLFSRIIGGLVRLADYRGGGLWR